MSDATPPRVRQSEEPRPSAPGRSGMWPDIYRLIKDGFRRQGRLYAISIVAMVLVAASFSLRFFRFGGVAKMVTGGVASGFVLYVATKLVGDLGGAGLLSTPVAAWSPAVVGSMLGTLVLLHQEDG